MFDFGKISNSDFFTSSECAYYFGLRGRERGFVMRVVHNRSYPFSAVWGCLAGAVTGNPEPVDQFGVCSWNSNRRTEFIPFPAARTEFTPFYDGTVLTAGGILR
jgi:hypothetical protein